MNVSLYSKNQIQDLLQMYITQLGIDKANKSKISFITLETPPFKSYQYQKETLIKKGIQLLKQIGAVRAVYIAVYCWIKNDLLAWHLHIIVQTKEILKTDYLLAQWQSLYKSISKQQVFISSIYDIEDLTSYFALNFTDKLTGNLKHVTAKDIKHFISLE